MIFLPETWFISVFVERVPCHPLWINPLLKNQLKEAEKLLNELSPPITKNTEFNLGIVSKNFPDSFSSFEGWKFFKEKAIELKTERFFDPYSIDSGSGRNAILRNLQYKGIGRTMAATRSDWLHSWGGVRIEEALQELISERMLTQLMPQISVPLAGAFLYENIPQAFLIRSCDFIRCAQVDMPIKEKEEKLVLDHLERFFGGRPRTDWYSIVSDRFIQLMKKGGFHQSPNLENLTIEGRILDHHSLEWTEYKEGDPGFYCEVVFKEEIKDNTDPYDLIQNCEIESFGTSFDFLGQKMMAVKRAYDQIKIKTESAEDIAKMVKFHFPNWSDYIVRREDRNKNAVKMLSEMLDRGARVTFEKRSILLEFGTRKRHELYSTISHLVAFSQFHKELSGPGRVDLLTQILSSVSKKVFQKDLFLYE